jgi:ADP-L-glycero-D-manno-heptose 6-epimerase
MIIVTGGAGFIGSNLVAALDARGERVVVCDKLGHDDKWRNIAKRDLEAIIAPENLFDFLEEHGGDIEVIFHMGAISTTTETNVDLIIETNFNLSRALWIWCRENNVQFIYASSAATYGDGMMGFKDNDDIEALSKLKPLNPYGWSKHLFDRWIARQKSRKNGGPLQSVGLKFFNVYGPNEYHKGGQRSVAEQIYPYALRGEAFPLFKSYNPQYADGEQRRDFVWVGDCVKVMLWFLEHPKISGLFNLGSGKARSFKDLANALYKAAGKSPLIKFNDMPDGLRNKYQYFTQADMSKLQTIGYTASFVELEEGTQTYVKNYLDHEDKYV